MKAKNTIIAAVLLLVLLGLSIHFFRNVHDKTATGRNPELRIQSGANTSTRNDSPPSRKPASNSPSKPAELRRISLRLEDVTPSRSGEIQISAFPSERFQGYKFLVTEHKLDERDVSGSWLNPKGDLILVDSGSSWKIHDKNAVPVIDVPDRTNIGGKEYLAGYWIWKDNDSLVCVMMHNPGSWDRIEVDDSRVFLFRLPGKSRRSELLEVQSPGVSHGNVIRIEGVTKKGKLVLSEVRSHDYRPERKFSFRKTKFSSPGDKFMGVFDIVDSTDEQQIGGSENSDGK